MIYFDHAATTPISEDVRKSMCPFLAETWGNPSSIYKIGREAQEAICNSRHKIAEIVGAEKPSEIIFTSGATESNNYAIKGVSFYASQILNIKPHIIISSIEHHCVLDTVKYLEKYFGFEVTYLPVDKEGLLNPEDVKEAIQENTVIVSIIMGNNEMGAIQPIKNIGKIIDEEKTKRKNKNNNNPIVFHIDAVQSFAFMPVKVNDLGVDMLSLTAHKFYGPKGVGLLYIRRGTKYLVQQQGGAQENGKRAGTENTPYIVGMAKAMESANKNRESYYKKTASITKYLIESITKEIPDTELIGPKKETDRLPHIATFIFYRIEGESILINLDMNNIAASSGSACTSGSLEPSHVTKAMGYGDMEAHGAIRFSLGELNKKEDIDKLMKVLPGIVEKLRAMSPIKN